KTGRNAVNRVERAQVADPGTKGQGPEEETGESVRTEVPHWLAQVPYALVLSALAAGIVVVAAAYFKRGPVISAGELLLAASDRLCQAQRYIGMLAVRRRWVNLLVLTSIAGLLIVLAWVAPQLSTRAWNKLDVETLRYCLRDASQVGTETWE